MGAGGSEPRQRWNSPDSNRAQCRSLCLGGANGTWESGRWCREAPSHCTHCGCPRRLSACHLCAQVADALRERAQRIYDKYGNVMLETEGMTKAGIERKATTRHATGRAGRGRAVARAAH